jgi:mono/diheme cytochrome c family protein
MMKKSRKKRRVVLSVILILVLCSGMIIAGFPKAVQSYEESDWEAPPEAAERTNPVPKDEASIERGKQLYQKHCAICHGTAGRGDGPGAGRLNPKPTDLTKVAGRHSDGDIAWKIAKGRGPMPGWEKKLSENDIWDLTNFTQSLKK